MQEGGKKPKLKRIGKDGVYARFIKRPLDIVLSLGALLVLSPVLLAVALLIRVKLGSPVIFQQDRPGMNEKIFTLYKFRTMTDDRDEQGVLRPDADRLTKFGRFLRSSSLDELPELINILKGDMSWVGPRPLLVQYLSLYNPFQKRRHDVKPGLTGLAQVSGRNALGWEEKFQLDVHYVDTLCFTRDWTILLHTVWAVLKRRGINSTDAATMPPFLGTNQAQVTDKQVR